MQELIQLLHSTFFDMVILAMPVFVYLIKVLKSPSKIEVDVLTKLLLPLLAYLSSRLANLHKNHNVNTHDQLKKVADDVNNLKAFIKKDKRALG